ncbi:MAG TPA: ribosome-associated translation inhibitor RaiA [Anaerolineae bacterium]|nr:ribosome-associated translation inhibitor RaiA [Anaerolineae bacterium]
MELSIFVHNMSLTPRLRNYVEKKTSKLDRYMPHVSDVRVDLSAQNARNASERQIAQITVRDRNGTILRAEERTNDMFAAVDGVLDKLYRQIQRYRGKLRQRRRKGNNQAVDLFAEAEPLPFDAEEEGLDEDGQVIMRRKRFDVMPMSPEEAVDQMELLGHDFFVFYNEEDNNINVVYRRRDQTYGVLLPDLR